MFFLSILYIMTGFQCQNCLHTFPKRKLLEVHLNKSKKCENRNIINIKPSIDSGLDEVMHEDIPIPDLQKFNINNMFKDKQEAISAIIAGSRGSGKTTLINYLYPRFIDFYDIVVFFSYSLHNSLYDNIQEPKFDKFIPSLVDDLFYFQKKTKNRFSILIILDDCMDNEIKNSDPLNYLFTRGRNSNMSVIFSIQYMSMAKNLSRSNSTFIFFGRSNTPANREILAEQYLLPIVSVDPIIKTKSKKLEYLDGYIQKHTKDHNFIVIDYFNNDKEEIFNFKVPQ